MTMLELNELSKIGFGSYRVTIDSEDHYHTLLLALSLGCNLIDTSSNYMDGKSEELIGKVLSDNPQYETFIITKAGYIQGENLQIIDHLNSSGSAQENLIAIDENFKYSLHPDFLQNQINTSLFRLKKKSIDGFLLHNPEYYFNKDGSNHEDIYDIIKNAFEFLENRVKENQIRYYGISSNVFSSNDQMSRKISLEKVLAIAREINGNHHFKLIQFPFNLMEQEAKTENSPSLIDFASQNNIITFSNRPLNANSPDGPVRLASYEDEIMYLNEEQDISVFQKCLTLMKQQLSNIIENADAMEIDIVKYLFFNWNKFPMIESASKFFDYSFYPFLEKLYQGEIPGDHLKSYSELRAMSFSYCLKNITQNANNFRGELIRKGLIPDNKKDSLQILACKYYLDSGINHVLIGMKREKYVREFESFFNIS
jgi:aryl-alcohol dehydrogenase-like predicted oxidoreductase